MATSGAAIWFSPGTYLVDSNLTISVPVKMQQGAKFKVANGVTLTINGAFDAPVTQAFTVPGSGVVLFGPSAVVQSYPQWFGAIADTSVTDNAPPTQLAVNSMPWGGKLKIPGGSYKFANEVTLHAGIIVEGAGGASDFVFGAPPAVAAVPSYLWQTTSNKAIFVINGGMNAIAIRDIAFSPNATPSPGDTPPGLGKIGIKIEGTYPVHIWNLTFERLLFYALDRGISCVDTLAGTVSGPHPFDWSVATVVVRQCDFRCTGWGIFLNSNNADSWEMDGLLFPAIPPNGIGIYLFRFGTMRIVNTNGGGSSISNNQLINIEGNGTGGADSVTIVNCGAENCTQFVSLTTTGAYLSPFLLTMTDCWNFSGAEVYLGNKVHFVSRNNHWVANVNIDSLNVTIDSQSDWFDAGAWHFTFLSGQRTQILNYVPGPQPDTNIPGAIVNGKLLMSKTVTAIADAVATAAIGVTVPNKALAAQFRVTVLGSIGAGGAVGADEASASNTYIVTLTRTPGKNVVAAISAAFGGGASNVAGGTTVTCTAALSAVTGGVGTSNAFTVNVTITRGGGLSTNHTCLVTAEENNAVASGITLT